MTEVEWLQARKNGIGASDAACILGLNLWKSNVQLWEEKTGIREAEDISDKAVVTFGKQSEAPIRELFALDYPQYEVRYDEFGMVRNLKYPWLFATLDGELLEGNRKGVLEIKTTEIQRSNDWKKWDNQVPQYYYTQVLHQLLATGYDFAILKARIKYRKDGNLFATVRHYHLEAKDCKEDMAYLLQKEIEFWELVKNKKCPSRILPTI